MVNSRLTTIDKISEAFLIVKIKGFLYFLVELTLINPTQQITLICVRLIATLVLSSYGWYNKTKNRISNRCDAVDLHK